MHNRVSNAVDVQFALVVNQTQNICVALRKNDCTHRTITESNRFVYVVRSNVVLSGSCSAKDNVEGAGLLYATIWSSVSMLVACVVATNTRIDAGISIYTMLDFPLRRVCTDKYNPTIQLNMQIFEGYDDYIRIRVVYWQYSIVDLTSHHCTAYCSAEIFFKSSPTGLQQYRSRLTAPTHSLLQSIGCSRQIHSVHIGELNTCTDCAQCLVQVWMGNFCSCSRAFVILATPSNHLRSGPNVACSCNCSLRTRRAIET